VVFIDGFGPGTVALGVILSHSQLYYIGPRINAHVPNLHNVIYLTCRGEIIFRCKVNYGTYIVLTHVSQKLRKVLKALLGSWPFLQPVLVPCSGSTDPFSASLSPLSGPKHPLFPLPIHTVTFFENDDINMHDSTSVGYKNKHSLETKTDQK
jgi:hypothetical protein